MSDLHEKSNDSFNNAFTFWGGVILLALTLGVFALWALTDDPFVWSSIFPIMLMLTPGAMISLGAMLAPVSSKYAKQLIFAGAILLPVGWTLAFVLVGS